MPAPTLVFVTRKFPPAVGGMETLSESVWRCLRAQAPGSALVANGRGNRWLPWFLPRALWRVLLLGARRPRPVVLCGDALTYAVLAPLLRILRMPCATMVMGLDITHENRLYRQIVWPRLRAADRVLAISRATADAAVDAGVPRDRVSVVRLGVQAPSPEPGQRAAARTELQARLALDGEPTVLVTLGRVVRRKGSRWFTEEVVPSLPPEVHYVVAGSGPDIPAIEEAVGRLGLQDRVHLLGAVSDHERDVLMMGCNAFVQPNIRVPGDMEGFGLVAIEAAMRGTLVVASDLEGLADAVLDGETGVLLPPHDPAAWIDRLRSLCADTAAMDALGAACAAAARERYDEAAMGRQILEQLTASRG